ncbi:MAG: hypothetical protein BGO55_00675 [Sphingobacteriales bacterium 50-39]|nr:helix-turn-helix transcriptional regulator [Sphingobacteriales bacterium]OJW53629.1 MAG: hypothetical protein BGO55_00675 [Sphingobacteriales bacterium 50-39]
MNYFSKNITHLRNKKNRTQQEIADALGVKLKRYQAWEEGRALPRLPLLLKLCELHGKFDLAQLTKADLTVS